MCLLCIRERRAIATIAVRASQTERIASRAHERTEARIADERREIRLATSPERGREDGRAPLRIACGEGFEKATRITSQTVVTERIERVAEKRIERREACRAGIERVEAIDLVAQRSGWRGRIGRIDAGFERELPELFFETSFEHRTRTFRRERRLFRRRLALAGEQGEADEGCEGRAHVGVVAATGDAKSHGGLPFRRIALHDGGAHVISPLRVSGIDARRLLQATNGALTIDEGVIPGWRLYDAHPHEERATVRLELVDDADRIVDIEVHSSGDRLTVEWRKTSADFQAAAAARGAIEKVLKGLPVEAWRAAAGEGAFSHARVLVRDVADWSDPLLAADFRGYHLLHGCRPRRVRVSTNEYEAPGDSVTYPAPVRGRLSDAAALYPFPRRFGARRRFRNYLAKLGFALDEDGRARTVPLPKTFRTGVVALTGDAPVWLPRLQPFHLVRGTPRGWAKLVAAGELPVIVPPIALMRILRLLPERIPILPPFAPGLLAHDMSLHAFALHRVRPEALQQIFGGHLSTARRRRLKWLSHWFEQSLTRRAWNIWKQVERPDAFDAMFAETIPSLSRSFVEEVIDGA